MAITVCIPTKLEGVHWYSSYKECIPSQTMDVPDCVYYNNLDTQLHSIKREIIHIDPTSTTCTKKENQSHQ